MTDQTAEDILRAAAEADGLTTIEREAIEGRLASHILSGSEGERRDTAAPLVPVTPLSEEAAAEVPEFFGATGARFEMVEDDDDDPEWECPDEPPLLDALVSSELDDLAKLLDSITAHFAAALPPTAHAFVMAGKHNVWQRTARVLLAEAEDVANNLRYSE